MGHTVIYIPGLGDRKKPLLWMQKYLLRGWRAYGLHVQLFVVEWTNDSPFTDRFDQLLQLIDDLQADGQRVSLVGASAGASTAISAYVERRNEVTGVVSICGQLRGTNEVLDPALDINPRFRDSLQRMQRNLDHLRDDDGARILTLRPYLDAVVPPDQATLRRAVNKRMSAVGHLFGIGFAIVSEGWRISRFLRRL